MTAEFSSMEEAARLHTEQFVVGLDAGIEIARQYEQAGAVIDVTDSDAFHIASNRVLIDKPEVIKDYSRTDFEVVGMGIVAAFDEAARRQGVTL